MGSQVWCWRRGDSRVFTKKSDIAQQAVQAGHEVSVLKQKTHIYGVS